MKAVLRSLLCMLLILTAFVNTGCAKGADEDADYKVYYLNKIQKLFPVHTSCRQKIRKRREEAEKKQKR